MATYECSKCGMSVNATCTKCNTQLVNDTLKLRIDELFESMDWRVITLKFGKKLQYYYQMFRYFQLTGPSSFTLEQNHFVDTQLPHRTANSVFRSVQLLPFGNNSTHGADLRSSPAISGPRLGTFRVATVFPGKEKKEGVKFHRLCFLNTLNRMHK